MTVTPVDPVEQAETEETTETELEAATETETSEVYEFKTSYVIEVPPANEVSSIYFVALGAVLAAYAIMQLIVGIVRK